MKNRKVSIRVQINKLLDSIDLLCVDMFQTLVDVKPRIPFIWKRILQEQYTPELAESCFRLVQIKIIMPYHKITGRLTEFQDLKTLFIPLFKEIKEELGLDYDEAAAARIFRAQSNGESRLVGSIETAVSGLMTSSRIM